MAEKRETPPPQQIPEKKPGPVSFLLFYLPLKLLGLFLFSIFLSILFEFIGLTFFWPTEGWQHSQNMLLTELSWFSDDFRQGATRFLDRPPVSVISQVLGTVHEWVMVRSGLENWLISRNDAGAESLQSSGAGLFNLLREYILAAVNILMVCILRVLVLLFTLPFFFLVIIAATTEGWMRRELRRFGAAYESSFIYHKARQLIKPLFLLPWLIYLNMPCAVWPPMVLIPSGLMLGCAIMVTVSTFKKYL